MSADAGSREIWNTVRAQDADRYLSALFAPASCRDALMALHAFHCEASRIPRIVSEPMLGEIRLQWWRDALGEPEKVTGNLLADALNDVVTRYGLPRPMLIGALDARAFDLSGRAMPDMQALCAYLGKTQGANFALAAHVLGGKLENSERAARDAGIALGLTRLLLDLPRDPARLQPFLPADEVTGAGDAAAVKALRERALEALTGARKVLAEMPKAVLPAFLPLASVEGALRAIRGSGDSMQDMIRISPLARHWKFWRAVLRGRV